MLEDLTNKIKDVFHPQKIILFGSTAWGIPNDESDIDLFIIMESNEASTAKRAVKILSECHPGNISVDLIVRTPEEVKQRLNIGDPFIKKVLNEGKVLYEESH